MGNRAQTIADALQLIEEHCGSLHAVSQMYETGAWGFTAASFINNALTLDTNLTAEALLKRCQEIEKMLGKKRSTSAQYESRPIDIDLLFFENQVISQPGLKVPHPRLHERLFVLKPLADISPDFMHPTLNKTVAELLDSCPDKLEIAPYSEL